MTIGQIKASIDRTKKLLKELELLKSEGSGPTKKVFIKDLDSLREAYGQYTRTYSFHFLLQDESILIFDYDLNDKCKLNYTFIENPSLFVSYEEYLESNGLNKEEADSLFHLEYEQFLDEQPFKGGHLHIRYDHSPELYKRGLHPASHIHFGIENDIRIPTSYILTPLMFCSFIVKQVYPRKWEKLIRLPNLHEEFYLTCKSNCSEIEAEFFEHFDKLELYLK